MPMTPIQRYRLRQYLDRVRKRKEYAESLKNRTKIFSGIKKVLKVGFWLCVLFVIVEFL